MAFLGSSVPKGFFHHKESKELLKRARQEIDDSITVLSGAGLHPDAVAHLKEARRLTERAISSIFFGRKLARQAIREQERARAQLVE
jgi:hypothetical protein